MTELQIQAVNECALVLGYTCGTVFFIWLVKVIFDR